VVSQGALERFPLRRRNTVTAMPDVVGAFLAREEVEGHRDEAADLLVTTRTCGAQERFQFGEGQFDRIEIGAVGREEPNGRAHLLDRGPHRGLLVDHEVVEHDDIARSQRGHQHLFHIGEETRIVEGPIEHRGGAEPLEPERGDHRVRLPMTAGGVIMEPGAARAPAIATEQIRRHAAFIEKHVLPHIAERLPLAPVATVSRDVGPALFVGVYGFF
jgi:hypothetical protein